MNWEIDSLVMCCNENNLSTNIGKTKELIIDFRKEEGEHATININGTEVERVKSIKFLRDRKKLQKVVCIAQTNMEANVPSMDCIYMARCRRKVASIIKDPSHPGTLFLPLQMLPDLPSFFSIFCCYCKLDKAASRNVTTIHTMHCCTISNTESYATELLLLCSTTRCLQLGSDLTSGPISGRLFKDCVFVTVMDAVQIWKCFKCSIPNENLVFTHVQLQNRGDNVMN
eukprot:g43023.t1